MATIIIDKVDLEMAKGQLETLRKLVHFARVDGVGLDSTTQLDAHGLLDAVMDAVMDEIEQVEPECQVCPECKGDIEGGPVEIEGKYAVQEIGCLECDFQGDTRYFRIRKTKY